MTWVPAAVLEARNDLPRAMRNGLGLTRSACFWRSEWPRPFCLRNLHGLVPG